VITQKTIDASKNYISSSQAATTGWAQATQKTTSEYSRRVPRALKSRFLTGLKILIPLGITIFILVWFFGKIDGILQPIFRQILGRTIPGLGLFSGIIIILIIGIILSTVFGRKLMTFSEKIILKIPIIRSMYFGIKQIVDSFSAKEQGSFYGLYLSNSPRQE